MCKSSLRKILLPNIELGKIVPQGILMNIICSQRKTSWLMGRYFSTLLHQVAHVKNAKKAWDNLYQHLENDMLKILKCQNIYNLMMEGGISMQAHIDKLHMIAI